MLQRTIASFACTALLATASLAQMGDASKPMPSPPAVAAIKLGDSAAITIKYNAPSMRGRKIMGGLVPFGTVWRTGANPATTLITATDLKIGTLTVPAGTYTIYTLPAAGTWQLIINKQTGQWGTVYDEKMDLGRTPMTHKAIPSQEVMSISFEGTSGNTTELHVKWDTTDEFVKISAK
jgi:Protein of unknown function (DUF2911)